MSSLTRLSKILNHLNKHEENVDTISVQLTAKRSMDEIERRWTELVGTEFGESSWIQLTQKDLDTFSDLTYGICYLYIKLHNILVNCNM